MRNFNLESYSKRMKKTSKLNRGFEGSGQSFFRKEAASRPEKLCREKGEISRQNLKEVSSQAHLACLGSLGSALRVFPVHVYRCRRHISRVVLRLKSADRANLLQNIPIRKMPRLDADFPMFQPPREYPR